MREDIKADIQEQIEKWSAREKLADSGLTLMVRHLGTDPSDENCSEMWGDKLKAMENIARLTRLLKVEAG